MVWWVLQLYIYIYIYITLCSMVICNNVPGFDALLIHCLIIQIWESKLWYKSWRDYGLFCIISSQAQILTIRRILEGVRAKNLQATLIFVDFTKAFDSIHRGKMEQILLAYGIPKETVAAITILYRNTKVKVRSPDGDTEYFDIVVEY